MVQKTFLSFIVLSVFLAGSSPAGAANNEVDCHPSGGGIWRRREAHHTSSSVMIADNNASLWVFAPSQLREDDPVNLVLRYRPSPETPSWKYEFSCQSIPKLALSHAVGDVWALGCPTQQARLYNGEALASSIGTVTLFQWNRTKGRARIVQTIYGKNATDQLGNSIAMSADGRTIALVASAGTAKEKRANPTSSYLDVYRFDPTTRKWRPLGSTIPAMTTVSIANDGTLLAAMTANNVVQVFRYDPLAADWRSEAFQTNRLRAVSASSMALAGNGRVLSLLQDVAGGGRAIQIFRRRPGGPMWRLDSAIPASPGSTAFGWVASLSADGNRIALADPANHGGTVHVYDYHVRKGEWRLVGGPIPAMVPAKRESAGRHLHLSQDGGHVIVKAITYTAIYEYVVGGGERCRDGDRSDEL